MFYGCHYVLLSSEEFSRKDTYPMRLKNPRHSVYRFLSRAYELRLHGCRCSCIWAFYHRLSIELLRPRSNSAQGTLPVIRPIIRRDSAILFFCPCRVILNSEPASRTQGRSLCWGLPPARIST